MERRLTFRDYTLLGALAVLFLTLLLAMYMIDRQWLKMDEIERRLAEQGEDIRALRTQLQQGVSLAGPAAVGESGVPAAFRRAFEASRKPGYRQGDWLVMAFGTGLKTITPLISSDAYASEVQSYVLESLLTRDPETLEWHGLLARDWTVGEDGLTFTFHLREGLTFSDGVPLTADDVAFSFAFIMDERIAAPRARAYFEKIASVTALDALTVEFRFREPYFDALSLAGGMEVMPKHFYGRYRQRPDEFNQSRGLLLGSGPYRLADPLRWTPDKGLVELERNPRYWGPVQPPFDRVLWKVIENDAARLTTFRNGEIDVYGARPREYRQLLADRPFMERVQHFEYLSPTAGYSYIAWNQRRADKPTHFADARVRRAMTLLTDIPRIIDEVMLGFAEPAVSPFNPRSPQHDAANAPWKLDIAQARALLQDAGFTAGRDGVLRTPEGKPFEFELVFFQDNEDTRRVVLFLKDLYAKAGIRMNPKPTEWSVMLDLLNRKDFDAITLGWTSGIETDIYQMFHSSQTVAGGDNFIHYRNPELDRLIEKARATVDEAKRMPLWREAERILYEDQPYTFLFRRKTLAFVDRRIANLQTTRVGLNLGFTPVEIYVPAGQHRYGR